MKRLLASIVLLAGLAASPVQAFGPPDVEARYTPAFRQCIDGALATSETMTCIGAELAIQDAALNGAYQTALGRMNGRQQDRLRVAQRAWIAYRDADCASLRDLDWGSMSMIEANFCVLRRTVERTIDLERFDEER